MSQKEVHIIHHYHKEPIRKRRKAKRKTSHKKVLSVAINVIEEIVRLL